jgi:hypothetical protein
VAIEDVVTKIDKIMLRWFSYVERLDGRRLAKEIYDAELCGNTGSGRPRRTVPHQIGPGGKR